MIALGVHSWFSLMQATPSPERLCRAASELGYSKLALTDIDNVYGVWDFLAACKKEGITPLVGAQVTEREGARSAFCLVKDNGGWSNLCRLISKRKRDEDFSLVDEVIRHDAGLVMLTADPELLQTWAGAGIDVCAALPRRVDGTALRAAKTARRLGLPSAVIVDSYFIEPEELEAAHILRAIENNTSVSRLPESLRLDEQARLVSPKEYARRFETMPEALATAEELVRRCNFRGPCRTTIFPAWSDARGRSAKQELRERTYTGARRRYGADLGEAVVERIEHELEIIEEKGFCAYFLVVRDIVSRSPRICGRGSGAASLVAYCLGITNVCPLKHNLYFERFLNPGRSDPPDIDVDFAWDERDDVIDSVLEQYNGRAAMVCNYVTFRPRMAIRETAKVFGLPEGEIGRITRRVPWFYRAGEGGLMSWLASKPESARLQLDDPWPRIMRAAATIMGAPRYLSVHCGGVVITPGPIEDYVPVETAPKGVPLITWDKEGAEEGGLVKIDLLGNRSLGVIRDALANARDNGEAVDETRWGPEDDPRTQQAVAAGRTMGCFYIESPAMRLLQKKTRRGDFEHLVIHSSIIRPAANEFIREYVSRLHGQPWEPIHPLLEDVLGQTYGIMVYQEDVSKVAVALAGFSATEADGLRKILSKKDRDRKLVDLRRRFFEGARKNEVDDAQIEKIWDMIYSFSGYSFCKPHSASYARVSFQAAFLKVHFPAEFMAAVIGNRGGFYSTFAYVSEARRLGLQVLPPDVNWSAVGWRGRGKSLRTGLMSIKGVGERVLTAIMEQRDARKFASMADLLRRVRPGEDEARALVYSGACDSLDGAGNQTALLWEAVRRRLAHETRGEPELFGGTVGKVAEFELKPPSEHDRLRRQFAVLGFLCDRHPMVLFAERVAVQGAVKARDLRRYVNLQIRFVGWLITGKVVRTRQGDPMQFMTFEDETDMVETVFFPAAYRAFCRLPDGPGPFVLSGKVEEDFGAITLTVDRAELLRRPNQKMKTGS
jgi:DNA-directed DNA polymerase III PolC